MPFFPPLTVFDVETTGLDPLKGHRMIEIAGVRVEDGQIDEMQTFVSLVNPERDIPPEARSINKISIEDVKIARGIEEVLPEFLSFAEGSVLVAHNAQFDMSFLMHEKNFCWGYIDLPDCLCTLRLSRALFPNEFGHNLDAVARRLHLQYPQSTRHRALPDVLLTAHALLKMMEIGGIETMEDLMEIAGVGTRTA